MKINTNTLGAVNGKPYDSVAKQAEKTAATHGAQLDTIEIGTTARCSDEQFISHLKAQIMKDVRAGAAPGELADIKQQVASGEYELNVAEIARRILCDYD